MPFMKNTNSGQKLSRQRMDIKEEKKAIREQMLLKRYAFSLSDKGSYDTWICDQVYNDIISKKAQVIHSYLPLSSEIDINPLIAKLLDENFTVICPKTLPKGKLEHYVLTGMDQVNKGVFSTIYPSSEQLYDGPIDYIIVPGLAFDHDQNRLGYGGGYYDRFMKDHPLAYKAGLAYPFQMIDRVPTEDFDVVLDKIYFRAL
jgi:5-formyltetrahydrofolate cyclo-ligase